MLPEAQLVHCIEGRMRLRIPARRRDAIWFARVEDRLRTLPGIDSVAINALAASVLLLHRSTMERIAQGAREQGLFRMVWTDPEMVPLSHRIASGCSQIGMRVRTLSGGTLDVPGLAMLGLVAAGSWQMLKGKTLPAGLSLFWYASGLLARERFLSK